MKLESISLGRRYSIGWRAILLAFGLSVLLDLWRRVLAHTDLNYPDWTLLPLLWAFLFVVVAPALASVIFQIFFPSVVRSEASDGE